MKEASRGARLEVRHLQVIEAVQRLGSVTRAASSLRLTQPAVSHALREIERRLEVAVVVSNGRGIKVTATGERLAHRARSLLDSLAAAEEEALAMAGSNGSRLRLTTGCYTCYHWLPRSLAELQRRLPRLEVELVPQATRRPYEALLAREVDLAIVDQRMEHAQVEHALLFRDEMVALVPPDHPFAAREYLAPEDFLDQHLVLHCAPEVSTIVTDVLSPAGVTPARLSQLHLTEAVVETVKAGLGITVMARWAVAPQIRSGALRAVQVTETGIERRWWMATLRGARRRPGVAELTELLREGGLD